MEQSDLAEQVQFATVDKPRQSRSVIADEGRGSHFSPSQALCQPNQGRGPSVFLFNPFSEGYIAHGNAFTPVKHQTMLAADLANLPQFLCEPDDIVLLPNHPSADFLNSLRQSGFLPPEFVKLRNGRIDPAHNLCERKLGSLRPWAWGPDSVRIFEPLLTSVTGEVPGTSHYFNDNIASLYSKAWSAEFLRKVLAHCREGLALLCSEEETGVVVDNLQDALSAISVIRSGRHHRVVVKESHGLAGQSAIRLWEPEILPAHRRWLADALSRGRKLVVEPWLERELDFSVQLEMGPRNLKLCGYTGLINDRKGQFLANWAEANHTRSLPAKVGSLVGADNDISSQLHRLFGQILSLLEAELQQVGFVGPISIDAFIYRTPKGEFRVKPVVEINPRYTMGRLTVELMKRACHGGCGLFRLVTRVQARAEGFADLSSYASSVCEQLPLILEGGPLPKIRQGAICLNDPRRAQVCLAIFEVSPKPHLPGLFRSNESEHLR